MSTEHDETKPVPAAPAGEQPTTPIPRAPSGRTEEPTLVFDTFSPRPDRATPTQPVTPGHVGPRATEHARSVTEPAAGSAAGTPTTTRATPAPEPVRLDKPSGGPVAEPARTSAFAAAGGPERSATGHGSPVTPMTPVTPVTPMTSAAGLPARAADAGGGTASSPAVGAGGPPAGIATATATAEPPAPVPPVPVPPAAEREISTTLRVGTVVWGLILAIIGAGVIAIAAGARVDFELAAIGLLALAGVALVVGSVVTAARRKR